MGLQIETKAFQNAEARLRINRRKRRKGRRKGVTDEEEFKGDILVFLLQMSLRDFNLLFFNKQESELNQM